jgi:tRNA modification GTPase
LEGIRRSRESLERADLILHVVDRSEPKSDAGVSAKTSKPRILVLNKSDLPQRLEIAEPGISVSCSMGEGIENLKDAIKQLVWKGGAGDEMNEVMINSRHEEALRRARAGIDLTIEALESGVSIELAAMDLRAAVNAVGEIVGKTSTEDLLDAIFGQFCLGK